MSIEKIIDGLKDDDIIMVSDLDEIPNVETLKKIEIPNNTFLHCIQSMHQYYVNVMKNERWYGTKIFKYSFFKESSIGLNGMRVDKSIGQLLENCGWHLTFLGGVEKIKEKIKAYGHQEFNNDNILNNIEGNVVNNSDIFYRGDKYIDISLDFFPEHICSLIKKYPIFIKNPL
jgi:beta-1,4-mannosyl-glycoprotein beta-1,4-N-acetylglucosaminyltransferase